MDLDHLNWTRFPAIHDLGPAVKGLAEEQWQLFRESRSGKPAQYRDLLARMPSLPAASVVSNQPTVRICAESITQAQRSALHHLLTQLGPWRKGPFNLYGIDIDAEWRSDMKWDRVRGHISSLTDRRILDIGSSSGYYMFRMLAEKPRWALGLEPYWTYFSQFIALNHYAQSDRLGALPVKFEQLPAMESVIDTAFCMGVLYHQRLPMDLLSKLHWILVPGGELILETLIIDTPKSMTLRPPGRYAKMPNVHALPSIPKLTAWLEQAGFTEIRCAGVSITTTEEQHRTEWMTFESLADFLDPADPDRTIEGHPAPRRAIMICRRR